MILGIDVGGTHTDAVLIENCRIIRKAKVLTNSNNIIATLVEATAGLFQNINPEKLIRVVLSTTISTNAIVQHKTRRVGMIVAGGPGLSPSLLPRQDDICFLSGYVNHRGIEITGIDHHELDTSVEAFLQTGIEHLGVVGKFSTRNPTQEQKIGDAVKGRFKHVSLGHRLSGHLNFRRRISTTYLNAAVSSLYRRFALSVLGFVRELGIHAPIYILKADGGTIDIEKSIDYPAQTILSGPAASIMGVLGLVCCQEDAIALDIGGTTTDIALFADGVPLLEGLGVTIQGQKTLIRGLRTRSIGAGGDSRVKWEDGHLVIGPEREGPAAAFGGPYPTPTDAMIALNLTDIGNRDQAVNALSPIALQMKCSVEEAARQIFDQMCRDITLQVQAFIKEINEQPVYTIHEMLEGKKLHPTRLYIVGGPAAVMAAPLGKLLTCTPHIPDHAEVANAIGAALARTTAEITILADTERKFLTIAEEGCVMAIPPRFTKNDAIAIGQEKLYKKAVDMGAKEEDLCIEVVEEQEFNMIKDFCTAGKNIRVKLQIKPGLIAGYNREGGL
ncbi:MAG: hypothetical protein CSYNP_01700 [Syntrophus sp. SKADARSKE-3]|nr:hypothetical protein [Syntrophus sp. SKADARSKE-3]